MGQPIAGTAASAAVNEVDDEWEYEYDPNETEDLYFTLDLTTHVQDALVKRPTFTNGSQHLNGSAPQQPSNEENEDDEGSSDDDEDEDSAPVGRLQIVDLHTTNPLVKLDDEVFNCYWSTDLGTQVHIAQAGEIPNPRKPGTVLDIVGTSQTRLIGKPITLKRRDDVGSPEPPKPASRAKSVIDLRETAEDQADDMSRQATPEPYSQTPGQPLEIPREMCTDRASREQASFLERFSQAKLKKGEKDTIPLHTIRQYELPKNVDQIRRRGIADENLRVKRAREGVLGDDRPRQRRRRPMGVKQRERHGGLLSRETITTSLGLQSRPPSSPPNGASAQSPSAPEAAGTPADGEEDAAGEDADD